MQRQCTATCKATRERCRRAPIKGGAVCIKHGGSAPQVKKSARDRLDEMVDPALTQLKRIVEEGETDAVKLAAIKDVLDRAGYKPVEKRETALSGDLSLHTIREALGVE